MRSSADGYAQAVTFGLLMARARHIPLDGGIDKAAKELRKSNSLIGSALRLLTEEADDNHTLDTSLRTLTAVLGVVDWDHISRGEPEAWLYFYELFLQRYDPSLRKETGSYYTPPEVVTAMVRLVDEALRSPARFGLPDGLASEAVSVADPAVGTGTFLLGVLQRIRSTIEARDGAGAVPAAITGALHRLVGFELQFGPLRGRPTAGPGRTHRPRHFRLGRRGLRRAAEGAVRRAAPLYRRHAGRPDEETALDPPRASRASRKAGGGANRVKRHEPITVVLGNPPYKEKAKGFGGWVEDRGKDQRTPLDDWQPPAAWGVGAHAKHLRNLYIYFWRWAAWKVFGGDPYRGGTDQSEADWTSRKGIVCFITVGGISERPWLSEDARRPATQRGRDLGRGLLARGASAAISTRIFEGVQQPVCIVMAQRNATSSTVVPARVRFRRLPEEGGKKKFKALSGIELDDTGWMSASTYWRAPFLPESASEWTGYPLLEGLFVYNGSGVMAGRTWVIAPDAESLRKRWKALQLEKNIEKRAELFHPHIRDGKPGDKHIRKALKEGLFGHEFRSSAVEKDVDPAIKPIRYGFNSFNRQSQESPHFPGTRFARGFDVLGRLPR